MIMSDYHDYENTRRVVYGGNGDGDLCFLHVCEQCGRYVKADGSVLINGLGRLKDQPSATCSKCGRIKMFFEGFI